MDFFPTSSRSLTLFARSILFFILLSPVVLAEEISQVRIQQPPPVYDLSQDYYVGLLKLALQHGAKGRAIPEVVPAGIMEQGRASRELLKGNLIDVFWVGTDLVKEQELRAIRIPLERGLMGFRKFTILKQREADFANIQHLADLTKLQACQGTHWPDTKILKAAGITVVESAVFTNMFPQLVAGRCDFFPRGLHEGKVEIAHFSQQYPDLMRYSDIMLYYPFAIYFFTNKQNETLAQWLVHIFTHGDHSITQFFKVVVAFCN